MKAHIKFILFIISIVFFYSVNSGICNFLYPPLQKSIPNTDLNNRQVSSFVNNNMGFEPNLGQIGDFDGKKVTDILFSVKEKGFSLFFKSDGVSYVIYRMEAVVQSSVFNRFENRVTAGESKMQYARIDLDLLNANIQKSKIIFEDDLQGYTNYYLAHCPEGVLNVKSYRKITVKEVYPGIDWVFRYDERGELHHEFVITPGANPEQIKFSLKWADAEISEVGKQMTLSTPIGKIIDGRILSYEGINNVDVRYKYTDGVISYEVRNWTGNEKLIIDPPLALLWGTYYGGNDMDYGRSIVTDVSGNIFVTGGTFISNNFPTQNPGGGVYFQGNIAGGYDVIILKFTNSGVRQWATYYGGSGSDDGYSISTDAIGNLYVTGVTGSTNFPTQNPGYLAYFQGNNAGGNDAFILKFSNSGVRYWGTYYGGSGTDNGSSLNTDASGNLFVTGETTSTNFPTLNPGGGAYFQQNNGGFYDIFILKFSSICWRLWATYYGGGSSDKSNSITSDANGNLFVAGVTYSTNFPIYNPFGGAYFQGTNAGDNDAFILKFSNSGICQWATYYGGGSEDNGESLITDANGNLFLTGYTYSTNFPTQNPGFLAYFQGNKAGGGDAFILKFSNSGVRYWATYYGGNSTDYGFSLTADESGNLYATGSTKSTNFPTQNPGGGAYFQQNYAGGSEDAFILKFSNISWRQWATYYGGNGSESGYSITSDAGGNLFITGSTGSTNLPIYNPFGGAYFQGTNAGNSEVLLLKFESSSVGIKPIGTQIPESYDLKQNYPNPFNSMTKIQFQVPSSKFIKLIVFDLVGREVETLVNEYKQAGTYEVTFDGKDLPSGIYFYVLETEQFRDVKKMILLK